MRRAKTEDPNKDRKRTLDICILSQKIAVLIQIIKTIKINADVHIIFINGHVDLNMCGAMERANQQYGFKLCKNKSGLGDERIIHVFTPKINTTTFL